MLRSYVCHVLYYFPPRTCVCVYALITAVWVGPECGGIARCGAAWDSETAGNKVNDGALTMLY